MPLPGRPPNANAIANSLNGMSLGNRPNQANAPASPPAQIISTGCTYPYIQKKFLHDGEEYVMIEFLVAGRPATAFQPRISNDNKNLQLVTVHPMWFFEGNRVNTELQGQGENETFTQAHNEAVQVARSRFGNGEAASPAFEVPLVAKCRRDFMEIMRLDYDGKELVNRNGTGVRTFEHILRITLKTTRELLQKPAMPTTYCMGDPDAAWVHVVHPPTGGGGAGAGAGGGGGGGH